MISVGSAADRLDRGLLLSRGGFAWWYLDVLDEEGSGVVIIAAFGLPFLPGYASSARAGAAPTAGERPSLNIAVYERGEPVFYLLQEHDPADCRWEDDGEGAQIGRSHLRSVERDGVRSVEVVLDVDVPHLAGRLTGTVRVEGPALRNLSPESNGVHLWTPLTTACTGSVDVRLGSEGLLRVEGRGYHDRNGCSVPLHELGIDHWIWGRTPLPEGELIHYLLWPSDPSQPVRALLIEVALDGTVQQHDGLEVELHGQTRGWFGMPWWREVVVRDAGQERLRLRHAAVVDDGFFYLRFATELHTPQGVARGVGEAVRPDRVDLGWQRPLVRMAVHHTAGANSMWLPLFAGPAAGRWGRLFSRRDQAEVVP